MVNVLPGVRAYDLKLIPDERGFFAEILRDDWKDLLVEDRIVQANISMSHPGMVRAWHRHNRGQVDYFMVIKGAVKICAYDDREGSETKGQLDEIIGSSERLQAIRVPGYYWHGTKAIGNEPSITIYCVNRLYDYKNPDEERRPWNDPSIVDPRTKQPFDWNRPPHK